MKIIFLAILAACTQKYVDYDLIRKVDFQKESYQRPTTRMEVLPAGRDSLESCFNQWLFFSNAEKEKDQALPVMVRTLCPAQGYLMDTKMTETWWTTIIFTRACVEMETKCAEERSTKLRKKN